MSGSDGVGLTKPSIDKLNALTTELREIERTRRLEAHVTPTNLDDERNRALQALANGEYVLPAFTYEPVPDGYELPFEELLSRVDSAGSPWHARLARSIVDALSLVGAARERTGSATALASTGIHGRPSEAVLARARAVLADADPPQPDESDVVPAAEAVEQLQGALARAGLRDWSVRVDDRMHARMSVRAAEQVVRVRAGTTFTVRAVHRLIVHELGTHVVRGENGFAQPLVMAGLGLPGYLPTEEGLACWNEARFGLSDVRDKRRYAIRALAADLTLRAGFHELFTFAAAWLEPTQAFELAARAKRGMADCSEPGGDVKDHVYLSGLMTVEDHVSTRPEDVDLLFTGKIGISDLDDVRALAAAGCWNDTPSVVPDDLMAAVGALE